METTSGTRAETEEQRLIEIIVSGLTREQFEDLLVDISEMMDDRWPGLGAAVGGARL